MQINFPNSLDSFPISQTIDEHNSSNISPNILEHQDLLQSLSAIEKKIGADNSTDENSLEYKINNIPTISKGNVTAESNKITLAGTTIESVLNSFSIDVNENNLTLNNIGGTLGLAKGGTNNDLSGLIDGDVLVFDGGSNKVVGQSLSKNEVSKSFVFFLTQ
mgnify:CR=1 FL=1